METIHKDLMRKIAQDLGPLLKELNNKYKDELELKLLALVPLHNRGEVCEDCADDPMFCTQCVMAIVQKGNADASTTP